MDVKFTEIIKTKRKSCKTCFSLVYMLPCDVDKELARIMTSFGTPKFDLNVVSLLRIEFGGYKIKSRIGSTSVTFSLPKALEREDLEKKSRKPEFDKKIIEWLENKLDIKVIK